MKDYPSFEYDPEPELIGERLNYYTDAEDYARLEEHKKIKQKTPLPSLAMLICTTAVSAYEFYKTGKGAAVGLWIFVVFAYMLATLLRRYSSAEKAVQKFYDADPYCKALKSARFFEDRAEFSAFDKNGENVIYYTSYPYSLMDSITVTVDDYFFKIGSQSVVFPRRFAKERGADTKLLDTFKATGKMVDER